MDLLSKGTVRSIAKSLSITDLTACARDVIAWQDKGELPDGALRRVAARMEAEAGTDGMSSLAQAEAAVLRKSALRLIALQTGLRADQR